MARIYIGQPEREIFCKEKERLFDVLREAGILPDGLCGGTGMCGKCKVRILSGACSEAGEDERRLLRTEELESGIRLACMTEVRGDLEIEMPETIGEVKILENGYVPEFERDTYDGGYGIAMDIGTTTVVAALIDLKTGEELAAASMLNAQRRFGPDVLTRITYEYEHPDRGAKELKHAAVLSVNTLTERVCVEAHIKQEELRSICVAANCTMMHMLLGADARGIGRAPYKPEFLRARTLNAMEYDIRAGKDALLYCLPQVSAYIGADIVAGVFVCGLLKTRETILFIDIGTNGEIVLAYEGRLFCCSCAAGPALEGMNISSGMQAAGGAAEDVRIGESGVELVTIGGGEAKGICGSGILAVVKELLRTGIVKETGAFIKKEQLSKEDYRYPLLRTDGKKRELILQEHPLLTVTQKDVRQVQLAKGAILSGCRILLERAGIRMEQLDRVMVAGQFGAHLSAELLVGTGILPRSAGKKLVYVGNASKAGAYMALMSRNARREMEELAKRMEYIELSEAENYERIFAESMVFPSAERKNIDFCSNV